MFSTSVLKIVAFNHLSSFFIQLNVLEMQLWTNLKIKSKRVVDFGFNERVCYYYNFFL